MSSGLVIDSKEINPTQNSNKRKQAFKLNVAMFQIHVNFQDLFYFDFIYLRASVHVCEVPVEELE